MSRTDKANAARAAALDAVAEKVAQHIAYRVAPKLAQRSFPDVVARLTKVAQVDRRAAFQLIGERFMRKHAERKDILHGLLCLDAVTCGG